MSLRQEGTAEFWEREQAVGREKRGAESRRERAGAGGREREQAGSGSRRERAGAGGSEREQAGRLLYASTLGRTRTCNPWFRRPVLYPLSYERLCVEIRLRVSDPAKLLRK